ncbi:MAG: hypothetical protein U1F48_03000 [Burkholderiales bacterium]
MAFLDRNACHPSAARLAILLALTYVAGGCSWQAAYQTAQGWQRNQCYRVPDETQRERCLANTTTSYDAWQRQSKDAARN